MGDESKFTGSVTGVGNILCAGMVMCAGSVKVTVVIKVASCSVCDGEINAAFYGIGDVIIASTIIRESEINRIGKCEFNSSIDSGADVGEGEVDLLGRGICESEIAGTGNSRMISLVWARARARTC